MTLPGYFKRVWFWLGLVTGASALTGLVIWIWKTRPHGPDIQPVQIDFTFFRGTPEVNRGGTMPSSPVEAAREAVSAPAAASEAAATPAPMPEEQPVPETLDDLTILVGIGPRIAAALRDAGVTSFARLAESDPAWLRELLEAQKLRLANPESWPEQARLAAAGKFDEMKHAVARRRAARGG